MLYPTPSNRQKDGTGERRGYYDCGNGRKPRAGSSNVGRSGIAVDKRNTAFAHAGMS